MLATGFENAEVTAGTHVMFDCHGTVDHYCWDGGKTWVVDGEPEGDGKKWASATAAVWQTPISAMKLGAKIKDLQVLARETYRKGGVPDPDRALIFFHGLGLSHILEMAKGPATRPHMAPADMGSLNIDIYNPQARRFETGERVYKNSTSTLAYLCENMKRVDVKPYLSCWNIGFTRCAGAFMDMGIMEEPAYIGFILTDNTFLGGHPGTLKGLQSHLDFLPSDKRIVWIVVNYSGNLLALAGSIIAMGGHVSIGIGDYTYPQLGAPANAELIERIVQIARDVGREVANPMEAKAFLASQVRRSIRHIGRQSIAVDGEAMNY